MSTRVSLLAISGAPNENNTAGDFSTEICAATGRRSRYSLVITVDSFSTEVSSAAAFPLIGSNSLTVRETEGDCLQPRPVYSS